MKDRTGGEDIAHMKNIHDALSNNNMERAESRLSGRTMPVEEDKQCQDRVRGCSYGFSVVLHNLHNSILLLPEDK